MVSLWAKEVRPRALPRSPQQERWQAAAYLLMSCRGLVGREEHPIPAPLQQGKVQTCPQAPVTSDLGSEMRAWDGQCVPESPPPTTATKKQNSPPRETWAAPRLFLVFFPNFSLPPPSRSLTSEEGHPGAMTRASCFSQELFRANS